MDSLAGSHHHGVSGDQVSGVTVLDYHVAGSAVTGPHVLSGNRNLQRRRGVREEGELERKGNRVLGMASNVELDRNNLLV